MAKPSNTAGKITFKCQPAGEAFEVLANTKPLKTPKGNPLHFKGKKLAEQTAAQLGEHGLDAPLYRLMSFALDMDREALTQELLEHFDTDLVCYPTDEPADLLKQQQENWTPIITWAEAKGIAPIKTTSTTTPLTQTGSAKKALEEELRHLSPEAFAGGFIGGKLAGSVLTGLALASGHISAEQAHRIAHTEELYQQTRYGEDAELTKTLNASQQHLREIEEFLKLSTS